MCAGPPEEALHEPHCPDHRSPFRRSERDELTRLINAHASSVIPGISASVNAVLDQLEREPNEFIVDSWVAEREALVATIGDRLVAAALLLHYRDGSDVGATYRGSAAIRWCLYWPVAPEANPFWADARPEADLLLDACIGRSSQATALYADGVLPVPGVRGVPDSWPHIDALYRAHGFRPARVAGEVVLQGDVAALAGDDVPGIVRSVAMNGVRFAALDAGDVVGYIEVDSMTTGDRAPRHASLADIGNLWVAPHAATDVAASLVRAAANWLRLGGVSTLLHYADADDDASLAFAQAHGFHEVSRSSLGWHLDPGVQ